MGVQNMITLLLLTSQTLRLLESVYQAGQEFILIVCLHQ